MHRSEKVCSVLKVTAQEASTCCAVGVIPLCRVTRALQYWTVVGHVARHYDCLCCLLSSCTSNCDRPDLFIFSLNVNVSFSIVLFELQYVTHYRVRVCACVRRCQFQTRGCRLITSVMSGNHYSPHISTGCLLLSCSYLLINVKKLSFYNNV